MYVNRFRMRLFICLSRKFAEKATAPGHAHAAAVGSYLGLLAFVSRFRMRLRNLRVQQIANNAAATEHAYLAAMRSDSCLPIIRQEIQDVPLYPRVQEIAENAVSGNACMAKYGHIMSSCICQQMHSALLMCPSRSFAMNMALLCQESDSVEQDL